jgi:hypothetical protein
MDIVLPSSEYTIKVVKVTGYVQDEEEKIWVMEGK